MKFIQYWLEKEPDFDICYEENFLSFIDIISEEEEKVKDEDAK